jgi:hypothetical protein
MANRREKNNREYESMQDTTRKTSKDEKYTEENFDVTDSDAAENNARIKQASQASGNKIEEGDEDYDDEAQDKKI